MLYAFWFLIAALLVKDTAPIGDVYVLRTLSQGMCLGVGCWWLLTQGSLDALRRYWLILVYILVLGGTAFLSIDSVRVLLQVLSLIAVALFFASFCERAQDKPSIYATATRIVIFALLPICIGSLLLYKLAPASAFDQTVERMTWDSAHRFKGLFGKPAGIAAASGVLLGLCAFTQIHWVIRIAGILSSSLCLYLTLSRSFWAGAVAALTVTVLLYSRRKGVVMALGACSLLLAVAAVSLIDVKPSTLNQSKAMRSDSLENLSGRTTLWAIALEHFWDSPVLGFGYTEGHHAFLYGRGKSSEIYGQNIDLFRKETFSLHNGYVQAMLDSGGVGVLLYLAIVTVSIWRLLSLDKTKAHAATLYSLLFLSIANIGETVVFTPATFHAAYYWYSAMLAFALRPSNKGPFLPVPQVIDDREFAPIQHSRYPLLSRPAAAGKSE